MQQPRLDEMIEGEFEALREEANMFRNLYDGVKQVKRYMIFGSIGLGLTMLNMSCDIKQITNEYVQGFKEQKEEVQSLKNQYKDLSENEFILGEATYEKKDSLTYVGVR